jgi:hypothetical protein
MQATASAPQAQQLIPTWYEELENSPSITMDRRGGSAQRVVRIAWDDINAFFLELFPNPYNGWGTAIFPGYPWLVVDRVRVEPFDPAPRGLNEEINYFPGGARVTVDYAPPERDPSLQGGAQGDKSGPGAGPGSTGGNTGSDQAFVTHKVSVGGEFITWPSKNLQWQDPAKGSAQWDPAPAKEFEVSGDTSAAVVMPLIEHTISWAQVLWPPWLAIRQCLGRVNAYEFAGAPPGTLLFLGAEASRELTPTGIKAWQLDYKFSEKNYNALNPARPMGWNYFLRSDGANAGTMQLLYRKPPLIDLGDNKKGAPRCTLLSAMDLNTAQVNVSAWGPEKFPKTGQFRVIIDPGIPPNVEEAAVIAGAGTNTWTLLRGIAGGRRRPHAEGAKVWQFPGRIYDIADFRYLFQPGMPLV